MTEDKIIALETALAHQEKQIEELNEIVHRQGQDIDSLKKRLTKTQEKLLAVEETANGRSQGKEMTVTEMAAAEKPPHY